MYGSPVRSSQYSLLFQPLTDFSKVITTWQLVSGIKSLKPDLSTVEIGSMTFARQLATDLVRFFYSWEEDSSLVLSHVASSDGYFGFTGLSLCLFLLVLVVALCIISCSSGC